jgi:cytochrome c oxidase subunit 3
MSTTLPVRLPAHGNERDPGGARGTGGSHGAGGARGSGGAAVHEHRDPVGAKMGMWLFLLTELILFGGAFLLYAAYRTRFPADFHYASTLLNPLIGGANTLVLLTSSLTMVLSIAALERGQRRPSVLFLAATIGLGLTFLVVKAFEWSAKIGHGIFPGSSELVEHTAGENIFFGLYYGMTGLHALHVIVGLGILIWMFTRIARRPRTRVSLPVPAGEQVRLATSADRSGRRRSAQGGRRSRSVWFMSATTSCWRAISRGSTTPGSTGTWWTSSGSSSSRCST